TYAIALLDTLDFLSERPVAVPLGVTATRPLVSLSRRIAMLKNPPFLFRLTCGRMALLAAAAALPMAIAFATEPPNNRAGSDAEKSSSPAQQNSGQGSENKPAKPQYVGELSLLSAALAAASNPIPPELQKPLVGRNWAILPLHEPTDLQRNFSSNHAGKLLVVINGKALLNDNNTVLNTAPLDMYALHDALSKYRNAGIRGFAGLSIHGVPSEPADRWAANGKRIVNEAEEHRVRASHVLGAWLEAETGFALGDISTSYTGGRDTDWNSFVADLIAAPTDEAMKRESGIGDDLVKVFPACTPYSRYLVNFGGEFGMNCMIRYMKSCDQYTPDEIKAIPERAKKYLDQLDLKQPARVCLVENYDPKAYAKGNQVAHELHEAFKTHGVDIMGTTAYQVR
ncbi:MAG: hypothetical protein ACLP9L_27005, partial [Thermoguttaceae bacterium]